VTRQWDDWACFWHSSTSIRRRTFVSAGIKPCLRFKRLRKMLSHTPSPYYVLAHPIGVRVPQVGYHCLKPLSDFSYSLHRTLTNLLCWFWFSQHLSITVPSLHNGISHVTPKRFLLTFEVEHFHWTLLVVLVFSLSNSQHSVKCISSCPTNLEI
jgi:hypothetical protein